MKTIIDENTELTNSTFCRYIRSFTHTTEPLTLPTSFPNMPTEIESSQDDHQETESVIICICQSGMSGPFVQHASNLLAHLTESQYHVQFVNQTLIR